MTEEEVKKKIYQKIVKIGIYRRDAERLCGQELASSMYEEDLDFYSTILSLLKTENHEFEHH